LLELKNIRGENRMSSVLLEAFENKGLRNQALKVLGCGNNDFLTLNN
jgi:hypothetical protein